MKLRNRRRTISYLIKTKASSRKISVLTIEKTSSISISPPLPNPRDPLVNPETNFLSNPGPNPTPSPRPNPLPGPRSNLMYSPRPYLMCSPRPNLMPSPNQKASKSPMSKETPRVFRTGRRQLPPPQPRTTKLEWCFQRCPITGTFRQTYP